MNRRTSWCTAVAALLAVGTMHPSLAATKKPKPKPIKGSYTASAYPDPTGNQPPASQVCGGKLPTGLSKHAFKIPAAGTLHVELNNQLDWGLAIEDTDGSVESSSDGATPNVVEATDATFKKGQPVVIVACNNEGEPSVKVSYTFTYK